MGKKTTSLTLTFSGLVMLLTSLVLFFGPPSHVGHFSDWDFLLLSRHHWGALHLNSGILFSLAMLFHIYFNWKPLIQYIKKQKDISFFANKALYISLLITLFVCVGSYYNISPMKQIMNYARQIKMKDLHKYGSPPYGSSKDYPISIIAGYMGWNVKLALLRLNKNNIIISSPKQSLIDVVRTNNTTIGHILDIMSTDE